jgi:universal stress protein A
MFHKILLPLDLTDKHQPALDAAADAAKQSGGVVELLHVIEVMAGLSLDDEKTFYQRLERKARKHLEKWGQQLDQRQVGWRAEVVFGARAPEVVRRAHEQKADLVVLTAPRLTPESPGASLGSVSYRVSLLAQCPVLLVK